MRQQDFYILNVSYKNVLLKKNPLDGDSKNFYLNLMM
jgi:hypothetical protein